MPRTDSSSATAPPGDEGSYPQDDLKAALGDDGKWRFTKKDGTPY